MTMLNKTDMHYILSRVPRDIMVLLREDPTLFMAGGIIRALIAQEEPKDIDLFGRSQEQLEATADRLISLRENNGEKSRKHVTDNAITVLTPGRLPVQFITRWVFEHADQCKDSFDFTICQAVIHYYPANQEFLSQTHPDFYADLAARRLVYTSPVRNEDAGGSLLRVIKYVRRGYSVQVNTLGAVCARLHRGVDPARWGGDEGMLAAVYGGLLREVDPLLQIDGVELAEEDDHNPERAQ